MAKKRAAKRPSRRTPKRLSHTLYSYVEPVNGKYARSYGKKWFGSFSAYVDALILIDRKSHYSQKLIKAAKIEGAKARTKTTIRTGKTKLADGKVHKIPVKTVEKTETQAAAA